MSQKTSPTRRRRPFTQVDVFTDEPYRAIRSPWLLMPRTSARNRCSSLPTGRTLSETTFLLPPTHPDADYRVRIFTAREEFTFAGHPTLGSAHAWLDAGGVPKQYTAAQGTVLGRAGRVHVDAVGEDIWVGGSSITCISGTVVL